MEKRKVIKKQTYKIEVTTYSDGHSVMKRGNTGFSVVEMLGLLSMVKSDLLECFKDGLKTPDKIIRKSKNSPILHHP